MKILSKKYYYFIVLFVFIIRVNFAMHDYAAGAMEGFSDFFKSLFSREAARRRMANGLTMLKLWLMGPDITKVNEIACYFFLAWQKLLLPDLVKKLWPFIEDWHYKKFFLSTFIKKDQQSNKIVGYQKEFNKLVGVLNEFKDSIEEDIDSPYHMLLYGPPGTGKTEMILYALNCAKLRYILVNSSSLKGDFTKNMHLIVDKAKEEKTALVWDEIELLVPTRERAYPLNKEEKQTLETLLKLIDEKGVGSKNIIHLGATNYIKDVDGALKRPGRFDTIEIGLPNLDDRKLILEKYLKEFSISGVDESVFSILLNKTNGKSGAEIKKMISKLSKQSKEKKLTFDLIADLSLDKS